MSFVHLHTHTQYSLLDGEARIDELVSNAAAMGMNSLAITDHGVMFGAVEFYKAAKKAGIKAIIGCEVYVAPRDRTIKDGKKEYAHLVLLAQTKQGYQNLIHLVSVGFTEGYYYKPRIDYDILEEFSEGLVCLSACLAGDIPTYLLENRVDEAKNLALRLKKMFPDRFYIEIQDHGISEQKRVLPMLISLARELDIPLVATNDIHYVKKEDAPAHDVLLCIQTGKTLNDPDRMRFSTEEFYLKSEEEMREIFSFVPEALDNTQKIADMCNFEYEFGNIHIPYYEVPEGMKAAEYLRMLGEDGLKRRYGEVTEQVRERFEYEFNMIERMGYIEYYLIVWDFINYARSQGIVVGPGRGSGAGSIVAYAIGITSIDPLKYNLLFERFLNPERVSMPDFDVDFCFERRGEVIDYVVRKYGADHVAQIITFGTMGAKLVIRDVGRVMNMPYADVDKIAKLIPNELNMTIERALEENPEFRHACEDENVEKLISMARKLEGLPRHASTHAAGVVISRKPIGEYVPLYVNNDMVSTQFTMKIIEQLGLLKMDFLGLRTLTVIRYTLEFIQKLTGKQLDLSTLVMDDPNVFKMIGAGDTDGVFQLESSGMRAFMKELKPSCFEDIVAGIALYRPGPMNSIPKYIAGKQNPETVEYQHPIMKQSLDVTYGCMVYQEQVMQIVRDIAGYSLGRSDIMRRAMSKKDQATMAKEREVFIYGLEEDGKIVVDGAIRRGVDEKTAIAIFDKITVFAQYAFNKSHAAVYGVVAYQTAFLKYYYPMEFMAAMLNSILGNASKTARYISYCREHSITVLPPDVNESISGFLPAGDNVVRFGLSAVKNVGISAVNVVVAEREKNGKYLGLRDFIERTASLGEVNKRMIESLIKVGAFDFTGYSRKSLLNAYEGIMDSVCSREKHCVAGQLSLFDDNSVFADTDEIVDTGEYPSQTLLALEKEMLGVYLGGHPLDKYTELIKQQGFDLSVLAGTDEADDNSMRELLSLDGKSVDLIGIISAIRKKVTKSGSMMAFLTVEDLYGSISVLVFPATLMKVTDFIREDAIIKISGKLSIREEDEPALLADTIVPVVDDGISTKTLYIRITSENEGKLELLSKLLLPANGDCKIILYYENKKMKQELQQRIEYDNEKRKSLSELFGEDNIKLTKS